MSRRKVYGGKIKAFVWIVERGDRVFSYWRESWGFRVFLRAVNMGVNDWLEGG